MVPGPGVQWEKPRPFHAAELVMDMAMLKWHESFVRFDRLCCVARGQMQTDKEWPRQTVSIPMFSGQAGERRSLWPW